MYFICIRHTLLTPPAPCPLLLLLLLRLLVSTEFLGPSAQDICGIWHLLVPALG